MCLRFERDAVVVAVLWLVFGSVFTVQPAMHVNGARMVTPTAGATTVYLWELNSKLLLASANGTCLANATGRCSVLFPPVLLKPNIQYIIGFNPRFTGYAIYETGFRSVARLMVEPFQSQAQSRAGYQCVVDGATTKALISD